ncbi:MAG: DUF624 domain-containing protein [Sphaerochaeta sp.]|nr:DUF624 domain-containing protein [Sphaerochaeta sp.]
MAMNSLFDPENSFWAFLTRIYNLAFAGFLWFVTSLPLITIGASTTALYCYAFSVIEQRDGYVRRTFFHSFRKNFVKATLLWTGMLIIFSLLFLDAYLASTGEGMLPKIFFFMIAGVGLILATVSVHVFPFLSQWDLPYKEMARHVFLLGVGGLPISITLVVVNALFVLLVYAFPPALLFASGFSAALCSLFVKQTYRRFQNLSD